MTLALTGWPVIVVDSDDAARLTNGLGCWSKNDQQEVTTVAAFTAHGLPVAIARFNAQEREWQPQQVLVDPLPLQFAPQMSQA